MKKWMSLVLALVMLTAWSVTAFAADAPASMEQNLLPVNGTVNSNDYVGWAVDSNGNLVQYIRSDDVTIGVIPEETGAAIAQSLSDMLSSIANRLGGNNQLTVTKRFDLKVSSAVQKYLKENGSCTIRFKVDLKDTEVLHVLHYLGGNQWEEITGSRLSVNPNGTVDVTFYSLSPVVFAVSTKTASTGVISPNTGREADSAAVLAVAAVAAFGCAVLVLRRRRNG